MAHTCWEMLYLLLEMLYVQSKNAFVLVEGLYTYSLKMLLCFSKWCACVVYNVFAPVFLLAFRLP